MVLIVFELFLEYYFVTSLELMVCQGFQYKPVFLLFSSSGIKIGHGMKLSILRPSTVGTELFLLLFF